MRLCLDCCKVSPRTASLVPLLERWRTDPLGSYQSWFLWDQRLKNFRTIRRGVSKVVEEIEAGTFGSLYRGSSLEIVVRSIAEQRQLFKGADHAFLWKPKLRIPDIYENKDNQKAFGRFLATCACCDEADQVVDAVHVLDAHEIKGLGPAVANLMYFLHPTLVPPSNTAIVRGYNALTGAKIKLGSWKDYLAMRLGVLRLNLEHGDLLSNDLGAIAGLLFDVGSERYLAPPLVEDEALRTAWEVDLARVREASAAERKASRLARESDKSHTEIQAWLRDLGHALGFNVWIAANDRSRLFHDQALGAGCLLELPRDLSEHPAADMVRLIDVLWLEKDKSTVAAAFEVEHTTSIYSGIVRLLDLEPILKLMLPAEKQSSRTRIGGGQGSEHRAAPIARASRESGCARSWCAPRPSDVACRAPCRRGAARRGVGYAVGSRAVEERARRAGSRSPCRDTGARVAAGHVGHA